MLDPARPILRQPARAAERTALGEVDLELRVYYRDGQEVPPSARQARTNDFKAQYSRLDTASESLS